MDFPSFIGGIFVGFILCATGLFLLILWAAQEDAPGDEHAGGEG